MTKINARAGDLARVLGLAALLLDDARVKKARTLGMTRVRAGSGELTVSSNVTDLAFTARAPAKAAGGGEIAVDGVRLAGLVMTLPKEEGVCLSAGDHDLTITSTRGGWRLPLCPVSDLPDPLAIDKEIGAITLDTPTVAQLLEPGIAASNEETRYYLNGILLHSRQGETGIDLFAVATDGTELVRRTIPAVDARLSDDRTLIVPNRTVAIVGKLIKQTKPEIITLRRSKTLLAFEAKGFALVSKIIDATFPDYERVIPLPSTNFAELDRRELIAALERLIAVESDLKAKALYPICILQWGSSDGLSLSLAREPYNGRETIAGETGGQARGAMATARLAELLEELPRSRNGGERIRLELNGPESVLKISIVGDPGMLAMLMPMRWDFNTEEART
jgi:DNA polymerase-3 subunit beta